MASLQPPPPPLPLRQDIENLVFTHKSQYARASNVIQDDEDPQYWERVAFLGEGILFAAMSRLLYRVYPRHRASWLNPERTKLLSKDSLASITDAYRFMDKLRCMDAYRGDIAKSLDNRAALAQSYVGGLALQYGVDAATEWAEDVLAWKHALKIPVRDVGRPGTVDRREDVMNDADGGRGSTTVPVGSPFSNHPQSPSRTPLRPEYVGIRPPEEVPRPTAEYETWLVQQPGLYPPMYPGGVVHPQVVAAPAAPGYGGPPYQPNRPLPPLPMAYQQTSSSPPAVAPTSPPPQPAEYTSFGYNRPPAQPSFFPGSISYHQQAPPPSAPQPQFHSPTPYIPTWGPQIPGASSLPYGPPTPSGPRAIPNDGNGGSFDPNST